MFSWASVMKQQRDMTVSFERSRPVISQSIQTRGCFERDSGMVAENWRSWEVGDGRVMLGVLMIEKEVLTIDTRRVNSRNMQDLFEKVK